MAGPPGWIAQAAAEAQGRPAFAPPAQDPIDAELDKRILERSRKQKEDRLNEMIAEDDRRAERKRLSDLLEIQQLEAKLRGEYEEPRGRGGRDDPSSEMLMALRSDFQSQQSELLKKLTDLQQSQAATANNGIQAQIEGLKSMISGINVNAASSNPIQTMIDSFALAAKVREASESLMPAPTLPPPDPGLSHQQMLDRERAQLEHEIRMIDSRAALETVQMKRDQLNMERESKNERLQGLLNMGESVLGQVAQAIAPSLAGMLPGGGGNGGGGGGGGAPAEVSAPVPAPTRMVPYGCPNCGAQNLVPPGTTHTQCGKCGYGPIILGAIGGPVPPGARPAA